jgi:hypothetical protein
MATDNKQNFNDREKAPLHRAPGTVDAGQSNDGKESSIVQPSRDMHTTKPTPGNEAEGQVAKM